MTEVKPASLRAFNQACKRTETDTDQALTDSFRRIGEMVRGRAASRTWATHALTAAGYRTRVSSRGVAVRQSLPKTTGRHPEWGSWQMREALIPATRESFSRIREEFVRATDKVCDRFERA